MLPLRLYLFVLTLVFLFISLASTGIGLLLGIVIVCPLIYLILDLREELAELKRLEAAVSLIACDGPQLDQKECSF